MIKMRITMKLNGWPTPTITKKKDKCLLLVLIDLLFIFRISLSLEGKMWEKFLSKELSDIQK